MNVPPGPLEHARGADSEHDVLVCDQSALYYHLHCDGGDARRNGVADFQLDGFYAYDVRSLAAFNTQHPLFGGEPVSVLVREQRLKMRTSQIETRLITGRLPPGSAMELRPGLFVLSPEATLVRMAARLSDTQIAEAAMNLCGRYYVEPASGAIRDRNGFLTTPAKIESFCNQEVRMRGSVKAGKALRWVLPNSGSPAETKMKLQFCHPLWHGGFATPFTCMNYSISSNRLRSLMEQGSYCLDLACPEQKVALEYDGREYHEDRGADYRRRNALRALGWQVFPVDRSILYDAEATMKLGFQLDKHMGVRMRKPQRWEQRFIELRKDLGLPV